MDALPGLYDRVPTLTCINLFVAAILTGMFWPVSALPAVTAWCGLMAVALTLRLVFWRGYRKASARAQRSVFWVRAMIFTTGLTGAVWGLAGVLFHGTGSAIHDLFLGFTIGGMIAGSATALTAHLPVFFAFYLPALLPYGARLAVGPDPAHVGMALLVAGFGVGIGLLGQRINHSFRASEARYRSVVEDQTELICRFRPDGTLTFVNGAYARYFGRSADDLVGTSFLALLPEDAREKTLRTFTSLSTAHPSVTYEHAVWRPDGRTSWQQWRDRGIFDGSGRLVELQSVGRDITERREAEEELRRARDDLERRVEERTTQLRDANESLLTEVAERRRVEAALRLSEDRLRVALKAARMGVWEQHLEDNTLYWSSEMERLFDLVPGSFSGRFEDFLRLVHPDDRSRVAGVLSAVDNTATATSYDLEYRLDGADGPAPWVASFGELIREGDRATKIAGVAMDITERKQIEEHALRLAHHDALTNLPNRRLLEDRLDQAIARARRNKERVAVMLLDLDNFKHVNDSLGHPMGDRLLCAVADRLGGMLRAGDTLARLGGDEFAVIQTDLREFEGASVLANKLIEALVEPFSIEQEEVHTSTSIGISLFPANGANAALLIKNADVALYRAKADGRNRIRFFSARMTAEAASRQSLESSLRQSLKAQDFVLYYQPVLDTRSGRITGLEALVRWLRPNDRVLLPELFIPLAESTGLIRPLGDWILREACRQAAEWQAAGRPLTVTVNLSAAQVRDQELPATVEVVIRDAGVDAGLIELEITENVLLDPALAPMTSVLRRLIDLGVHLSIDDFGTGYSSLAYLKHIPAQTIKVDRSFVRDINQSGDDEAIVIAVLALGRSLGKRVVAEGVERLPQMAALDRLGCADLQGFLISQPLPADDVASFLRSWPGHWRELNQALRRLQAEPEVPVARTGAA